MRPIHLIWRAARRLTRSLPPAILLLFCATAQGWDVVSLGGGAVEKMLIYDTAALKGLWGFDKDGGACWYEFDPETGWNPTPVYFNANYGWVMGGDADSSVYSGATPAQYALAATIKGHHLYHYDGAWEEVGELGGSGDPENNQYYSYHDGQFFGDYPDGDLDVTKFLVSTWNWLWEQNVYRRGIYWVLDGTAPEANDNPISGTTGLWYNQILRSLDPSSHNRVLYAWTADRFEKIVITGAPPYTAAITKDISANPTQVIAFYQYRDPMGTIHQYLLGREDANPAHVCIWHRTNLDSDNWGDPLWHDVEGAVGGSVQGLTAREYDHQNHKHYLYTYAQNHGLVIHNTYNGNTAVRTLDDEGNYFPGSGRHLTRAPETWVGDPDDDEIVVSVPHGGLVFARVNAADQVIEALTRGNDFPAVGDAAPLHPAAIALDCDASGGLTDTPGSVLTRGDILYHLTYFHGLFQADFSGTTPVYAKIGLGSGDLHCKADFNFAWHCAAISPFSDALDTLYLGMRLLDYRVNGGAVNSTHRGLWRLTDLDSDGVLTLANDDIWPGGMAPPQINRLCADPQRRILYAATNSPQPNALYSWESPASPMEKRFDTNASGWSYTVYPSWGDPFTHHAAILQMAVHPNPELGQGVICGLGIDHCDWGSYYGSGTSNQNLGGGLLVVYRPSGGNWTTTTVIPIDHSNYPGLSWFEHPKGILAESFPGGYPGINDAWKKMDLLVATAAWQLDHGTEDYWRYGGLFRITPTAQGWNFEDITPYQAYGAYQYKLVRLGDDFQHPAAMAILSSALPNSSRKIYFCTTTGELNYSYDQSHPLLWYQLASNLRELTLDGWELYPSPDAMPGKIPYGDGETYELWYRDLAVVNGRLVVGGVAYDDLQANKLQSIGVSSSNWNWVSFNTRDYEDSLKYLFAGCDSLEEIRDQYGNKFRPHDDPPVDSICVWNWLKGYGVNASGLDILEVFGPPIPYDSTLVLCPAPPDSSWICNYIAYLPTDTMTTRFAFEAKADTVVIVKNDDGQFWRPTDGNDGFNMVPGEGYQVGVTDTLFYQYPANGGDRITAPSGQKGSGSAAVADLTPAHFLFAARTGDFYPIYIAELLVNGQPPDIGDEVGVFTPADLCVGGAVFEGAFPLKIAAWKDDPGTEAADGYRRGETLGFRFYDASAGLEFPLEMIAVGQGLGADPSAHTRFEQGFYAEPHLQASYALPGSYELLQNYPNPFNPSTTLRYQLPFESVVKLEIFDLLGRKVLTLVDGRQAAGFRAVRWDGRNAAGTEMASGVYFYRLKAEATAAVPGEKKSYEKTRKMVLMK